MSLNSEIIRLQNAKADIKDAIEEKGVEVEEGTIDTYATAIRSINVGGETSIISIGDISSIVYESSSSDIFTAFGGESKTAEIISKAKDGNLFLTSKYSESNGKNTNILLNVNCFRVAVDQSDCLIIYLFSNIESITNINELKIKKYLFSYYEASGNDNASISCLEAKEYKLLDDIYVINTSIDTLTTSSTSQEIANVIHLWDIIIHERSLWGITEKTKVYKFNTSATSNNDFGYCLLGVQMYDPHDNNYKICISYITPANTINKIIFNFNSSTEVSSVLSKDTINL